MSFKKSETNYFRTNLPYPFDREQAIFAECDICGTHGPLGWSIHEAKSKAEKEGWSTKRAKKMSDPSQFVCNRCVKEQK